MTCHYTKQCSKCAEKHNCEIYQGIKAGYSAIARWKKKILKVDNIEKTIRKLERWRESHIKKLENCVDKESERYLYSERRIQIIEEQITELETDLGFIENEMGLSENEFNI